MNSKWNNWKLNQIIREFNGPHGQPDPSGISQPSLKPRFPSLPQPTSGTRPGMSMQSPELDQVYGQLLHLLGRESKRHQREFIEKLEKDLGVDHFDYYQN